MSAGMGPSAAEKTGRGVRTPVSPPRRPREKGDVASTMNFPTCTGHSCRNSASDLRSAQNIRDRFGVFVWTSLFLKFIFTLKFKVIKKI